MSTVETFLSWAGFVLLAVVALAAPWLFASWEMWWFWLCATLIFASSFCFGARLIMSGAIGGREEPGVIEHREPRNDLMKLAGVLAFMPFLLYAFVRFMQADVFMDAERSFLLFFTPFLIGVQIVFGFSRKQLTLLYWLVAVNILYLGLYGVINHVVYGSRYVLFVPGFPQYIEENRATGSYFCPDHFAGVMEIGAALGLGVLFTRNTGWLKKILAVFLLLVAVAGVVLSKSRGGGLTLVIMLAATLIWGFAQWPRSVRRYLRVAGVSLGLLVVLGVGEFADEYVSRFMQDYGRRIRIAPSLSAKYAIVEDLAKTSSRGRMYGGALRAWETAKYLGIGPGMHQNLWPHFAPSPDGDAESGKWPTLANWNFHSYEVHSDWLQLLEEYGIAGTILFLIALGGLAWIFAVGLRRETAERRWNAWGDTGEKYHAMVLGGILAAVAMAFHSFGDFNLQMPATVWILAIVVAIPVAFIVNDEDAGSRRDSHGG